MPHSSEQFRVQLQAGGWQEHRVCWERREMSRGAAPQLSARKLLILLELKLVNGCGGLAGRTARRVWCPSSWPSQKLHLELERNLPGRAEGGYARAVVPAQLQEFAQGPGPV